jgi:general stress protein CsbA
MSMIIVDALLFLAMLFFLFLPITDRKTVRMKLGVILAIAGVLAVSITHTTASRVQLASVGRGR